MAIVSKVIQNSWLVDMLDTVFNPANSERFYAFASSTKRGSSSAGNLYSAASAGSGNASVALAANVVINVDANSTSAMAITKITYVHYIDESTEYYVYDITISPAEEFLYAGTITITSATITISETMS